METLTSNRHAEYGAMGSIPNGAGTMVYWYFDFFREGAKSGQVELDRSLAE